MSSKKAFFSENCVMMKKRWHMIGVDLVYIPRVKEILNRRGEAFLHKVFSPEERANMHLHPNTVAAHFAAKEAMAKALGAGLFKAGFKNLLVFYDESGAPYGRFEQHFFDLSISHEKDYAVAVARLRTGEGPSVSKEAAKMLPVVNLSDHKGARGKAAVVGGCAGMFGSVDLAASAALRAGCGLSYAYVPDDSFRDFSLRMREVIVKKQSAAEDLKNVDALGLGPGMGRDDRARDVFLKVYGLALPMVVDADGLYHLAEAKVPSAGPKIFTPHAGEMARLIDRDVAWVNGHRDEAVDACLRRYGGVVVLKGHGTIVASKDDRVVNETGNAGMATAGSGDVLTGVIASFLAQGMDCFQAARLGVYIHGLAGDLAALHKSKRGMIASDIIEYLPEAFLRLEAAREICQK